MVTSASNASRRRWRCTGPWARCGSSDPTCGGAAFNIEFAALANHRKEIRDEIARYANRFREMQLDAITAVLEEHGVAHDTCPPIVVLLAMTGITQVTAIEASLGLTTGHREMHEFATV